MKASLIGCSVVLIMTMCRIHSSWGTDVLEKNAGNYEVLKRERRDEELHYPDDIYDSDEQDRWPTLEELGKRRLSTKRGGMLNGPAGLYDLLSTNRRPAPERRATDSLKEAYLAGLLKRHRIPRSSEVTTMKPDKGQLISE